MGKLDVLPSSGVPPAGVTLRNHCGFSEYTTKYEFLAKSFKPIGMRLNDGIDGILDFKGVVLGKEEMTVKLEDGYGIKRAGHNCHLTVGWGRELS